MIGAPQVNLTFYHFRYALVDFGLAHKAPVTKDKRKPVVEKNAPLSPSKTVESQENQVNLIDRGREDERECVQEREKRGEGG
jgi:hypothetical protein